MFLPQLLEDPGSDPVTARNRGARYPALGGDQHDAESLADGADLLLTGLNFEAPAANVAEYCDIPLATLDMFPMRANGQFLPAPLCRSAMTVSPSASLSVACRALVAASPR